jgi:hypothetical protein
MAAGSKPLTTPTDPAIKWPDPLNPVAGNTTSAFNDPVKNHDWPDGLNTQNDVQPGLKPGNEFLPRPGSYPDPEA